jgi:hypothetical protein
MCAKSQDTTWLTHLIEPYLAADGVLVGVQNSMNDDLLADIVGGEIWLDQVRQPCRILRLGAHQDDVERRLQHGQVADVMGVHVDVQNSIGHRDSQPLRTHCFDMCGPLVDDRHVEVRLGEIRGDTAADCAG